MRQEMFGQMAGNDLPEVSEREFDEDFQNSVAQMLRLIALTSANNLMLERLRPQPVEWQTLEEKKNVVIRPAYESVIVEADKLDGASEESEPVDISHSITAAIYFEIITDTLKTCCEQQCNIKESRRVTSYKLASGIPLADKEGNNKASELDKACEIKQKVTTSIHGFFVKGGLSQLKPVPYEGRELSSDAKKAKVAMLEVLPKAEEQEESITAKPGM